MKSLRFVLPALLSLSTFTFAQSATQPAPTEAQKSFETLKSLAGSWEGHLTVTPPQPDMHGMDVMHISLRVTLPWQRASARNAGSGHATGCNKIRPSGHDALCGW